MGRDEDGIRTGRDEADLFLGYRPENPWLGYTDQNLLVQNRTRIEKNCKFENLVRAGLKEIKILKISDQTGSDLIRANIILKNLGLDQDL